MKNILLTCIFFSGLVNMAFAESKRCHSDFWRNGIPREGNLRTPFPCEEFIPTINAVDKRYINFYYHTSRSLDPQLSNYFEKAAESIKLSLEVAKRIFDYSGKIKLILDFNDHPRDNTGRGKITLGNAYPFFANFGESCPIIMFPKSELLAPNVLGQIIAHELYHCVQAQKWPEQTRMANDLSEGRWHVEGSAQWFSDLIYPSTDHEYDSFWGFYDENYSVVDQSNYYTTVIFFQSMWETAHQSGFAFSEFFRKMPTVPGSDQLAAFSRVPLVQVYYHNYARNYVSRSIKDAEGKNAPVGGVELDPVELSTEPYQEVQYSMRAFKMDGRRFTLPAKSSFVLTYNAENDVRVSYKRTNSTEWKELFSGMPNQITSKCSGSEDIDVVFTSTKKDFDGEMKFNLTRKDLEDCGCELTDIPVDACLQGDWQMPTSTTGNFIQSNSPPGTVLKSTEGIWHLHLADHSGKFTYESVRYSADVATTSPINPKVPMDITLDGKWVFEASSEAQKVCFKVRTIEVDFFAIIHFKSGDVKSNLLNTIVPSNEGAIEFKCLGQNQLVYRRHSGLIDRNGRQIFVDWIFNRE